MPRTYTQLYYHFVFATKLRYPYVTPELQADLYPFIGGALRNHGGTAIAMNGMPDHVHILARLRAHPSVAEIMKSIKGSSSNWINDTQRTTEHFGWQEGYGAFTVSTSMIEEVRRYIENQQQHHRRISLREEMISLFKKHGVDFREDRLDF
ncbi:MAG: IS200/IS605 family transposase [Thermoanaerobaculia bacterium]